MVHIKEPLLLIRKSSHVLINKKIIVTAMVCVCVCVCVIYMDKGLWEKLGYAIFVSVLN